MPFRCYVGLAYTNKEFTVATVQKTHDEALSKTKAKVKDHKSIHIVALHENPEQISRAIHKWLEIVGVPETDKQEVYQDLLRVIKSVFPER